MNFFVVFVPLELLVVLQTYFAYKDKYLFMRQAKPLPRAPGKAVAVWSQHPGMISDLAMLTALCSCIVERYHTLWTQSSAIKAAFISAGVTGCMLYQWAQGSKKLDEHLARNGALTRSGCLHGLYMLVVMFVLILFFEFTPSTHISPRAINIVSCLTTLHVAAGFLWPEWITYKKVSLPTVLTAIGLLALILHRWLEISQHR